MAQFMNEELAMIAIILDEEEANQAKKQKWVHEAWKKGGKQRRVCYVIQFKLVDDGMKFF